MRLPADGHINLAASKIIGLVINRTHLRRPVGAIPRVTRVGEPEHLVIKPHTDVLHRTHLQRQPGLVNVLP